MMEIRFKSRASNGLTVIATISMTLWFVLMSCQGGRVMKIEDRFASV
jgi:hypothetical protein